MIRLFAALGIPEEIAEGLARRQAGLDGARWRPPGSLHITLKFFGDLREDVARDLDAELLRVKGRAFDLRLEGAGAFGDGPDVHAVWAGVAPDPELDRLAAACETAGRRVGLTFERRRYRPHVTLAYLRRADPAQAAAWVAANNLLKSPTFRVASFGLYSSAPGVEGGAYRLEAEYGL